MRYALLFLLIFMITRSAAQASAEASIPNPVGCTSYSGFPDLPGWEHEQITIPDSYNRGWKPLFINLRTGFLLGTDGQLLRTADGGQTWEKIESPSGLKFISLFFADSLHGFAGAHRPLTRTDTLLVGLLLRTGDGGRTWSEALSNLDGVPRSLHFFDQKHGLAIFNRNSLGTAGWTSQAFLARTADGAATWTKIETLEPAITAANELKFVTAKFGYLTGVKGRIYKTMDGGKSWATAETGLDAILALQFLDPQNGYAYGHNKLLKTTDGGLTWTTLAERLVDFFHFFTPTEGISIQALEVCGYANHISADNAFLITHDGGMSWINGNVSRNFTLKRIFFLDADHGYSTLGTRPGMLVRLKRK